MVDGTTTAYVSVARWRVLMLVQRSIWRLLGIWDSILIIGCLFRILRVLSLRTRCCSCSCDLSSLLLSILALLGYSLVCIGQRTWLLLVCTADDACYFEVLWSLKLLYDVLECRLLYQGSKLVETLGAALDLVDLKTDVEFSHELAVLLLWAGTLLVDWRQILLGCVYGSNSLQGCVELPHFGVK